MTGRVAMVSVHTSPLAQPGIGDAGGMNVYVLESARQLARAGTPVDIFTRQTSAADPTAVEVEPGVIVHHIAAGPYDGLAKEDLVGQLCAFTAGMMQVAARAPEGHYDIIHSHYWLSGQVGWLAADRWDVPLIHTMHTMARVKNLHRAHGDPEEPPGREIGEAQVVEAADRLVANTADEARALIELYAAAPERVDIAPPGVDLEVFRPGDRGEARRQLGIPADAAVVLFVGRIQPLKAPDVVIRAAAALSRRDPALGRRLYVGVLGGASGVAVRTPMGLEELAAAEGIADEVHFLPPTDRTQLATWMRAADIVAVPSHNESFGLVAIEAQACGAVVVASDVGGLPTAVGSAGLLVQGHDVHAWANAFEKVLSDPMLRADLGEQAAQHAHEYSWAATARRLSDIYAAAKAANHRPPEFHVSAARGIPLAVKP